MRTSQLFEHIIPNGAIGQSLTGGEEVHKVKPPKSGKHDLKICWRMR